MYNIKFKVEAGRLVRKDIHRNLINLKNDVLFREPDANIIIDENRGFLESEFIILMTNISERMKNAIQDYYKK